MGVSSREWSVIGLICGLILLLVSTSQLAQFRAEKKLVACQEEAKKPIEITVIGAVKNPGVYTCTPGTQVKEVLEKVGLLESANRSKVSFKKVLLSSQTLEIPEKKRTNSREKKISLVGKNDFCYSLTS